MVKGAYFKASQEPVLIQGGPSLDPVMKETSVEPVLYLSLVWLFKAQLKISGSFLCSRSIYIAAITLIDLALSRHSERSIKRYIRTTSEAGIPILREPVWDEGGGDALTVNQPWLYSSS